MSITTWRIALISVAVCGAHAAEKKVDPAEAAYSKAQRAFDAGDCPTAMRAFAEAFKLQPHPRALLHIAHCQRKQGDLEGAARSYSMIISLYEDSPLAQRARDLLAALEEDRAAARAGKTVPPASAAAPKDAPRPPERLAPPPSDGKKAGSTAPLAQPAAGARPGIPELSAALKGPVDIASIDTELLIARDAAIRADARGRQAPAAAAEAWKRVAAMGGHNPFKADAEARAAQWQGFGSSDESRLTKILALASIPPTQKAPLLSSYCKKNGEDETQKMLELCPPEQQDRLAADLCLEGCGVCREISPSLLASDLPVPVKTQLVKLFCKKYGDEATAKALDKCPAGKCAAIETNLCGNGCNVCFEALGIWRGPDIVSELSIDRNGQAKAVYDDDAFSGPYSWTRTGRAIKFSATGKNRGKRCSFTAEVTRSNRIEGSVDCQYATVTDFWSAQRAPPPTTPR